MHMRTGGIGIGIGFMASRTSGGGAPSLSAQVEAILAGKAGLYFDPTDLAVMWQDALKATPVTAPTNPCYTLTSKYGAVQYDAQAANDAGRPVFGGSALVYDGADDRLLISNTAFGQNAPALFLIAYIKIAVAGARSVLQISTNSISAHRLFLRVQSDGSLNFIGRRLDGDTDTVINSAAGLISAGTAYVLTVVMDEATTGNVSLRINGVEVVSGTLAGAPGNTSNTVTNRVQFGAVAAGASPMQGSEGRMIVGAFLPTPAEIATFEALVSEVAI